MGAYFTVCFCGAKSLAVGRALGLLDWLLSDGLLSTNLTVLGRKRGESLQLKGGVRGEYASLRQDMEHLAFKSLDVTGPEWSAAGTEVFFHLELENPLPRDNRSGAVKLGADPKLSARPSCFDLMTLSLRSDVWSHCTRGGFAAQFFRLLDRLFVDLGFRYGYADYTNRPIAGSLSLVRGGAQSQGPRIIDFDYNNHIEGIYKHNFISVGHLSRLPGKSAFGVFGPKIECTELTDEDATVRGMRISVGESFSSNLGSLRECLSPLLWNIE